MMSQVLETTILVKPDGKFIGKKASLRERNFIEHNVCTPFTPSPTNKFLSPEPKKKKRIQTP